VTGADNFQPLAEILGRREKWLLIASLMLALFLAALDQMIVSTATPRIVGSLGGFGQLPWLFTSYMLASTVIVPLVGKISDLFGRKQFLLAGIFVMVGASVACGAAPNMTWLIVCRAIQGLGAGTIFACVFASSGDLFPPAERGKYMGLFTGTFSLASILGPTMGGLLTDNLGWRWVFYVNVPIGLVAVPFIIKNLPARTRPAATGVKIDFLGAALLSAASVSLLLALVWAGDRYDWGSTQIVSLLAVAGVLTVVFVAQEWRHPEPIVPLHLFRNRIFVVANLIVFSIGMAMFGAMAYLPTFIQTALDTSATASGLITTPMSLGILTASVIGGQIVARTGRYRWQAVFGTVLIFIAILLLRTIGLSTPRWHISAFMVVMGFGFGASLPVMSIAIQNAVDYRYLGVVTSSNQFFRQIGGVMGTAIFGAVLATSYHSAFNDRLPAEVRSEVPPAVVQQFDNPTVALNEHAYAQLQARVLALPNGEQLLSATVAAQRSSITTAIRHIFTMAAVVGAFCVVLALFLRELPLRRTFGPPAGQPAGPPQPATAGAPAVASSIVAEQADRTAQAPSGGT
jgi:EmrB/QacA subfamily drug resistance transporter